MSTLSVRATLLSSALLLPLLAACATGGVASQRRFESGPQALARIRDSIDQSLAERDAADVAGRAPRVHITTPSFLGADRYVDASIRVSEDAYVFVVTQDFDGRYRVLFPESPDEAGFLPASGMQRLTRFFAGFGSLASTRYSRTALSVAPVSRESSRGLIVAIASDRPLQLDRLTDGAGNWSDFEIAQAIGYRGVASAAYSLGERLSLVGQQFSTDYSPFTQSAGTPLYSLALYDSGVCASDETDAMYATTPHPTRFFDRDGIRYAVITTGDGCTGFFTRTVPIGETPLGSTPNGEGSVTDSARGRPADPRYPGRAATERTGRFSQSQLDDDVVGRARRGNPTGSEDGRLRPAPIPASETGLRFRPSEQRRSEPMVNERPVRGSQRPLRPDGDAAVRQVPRAEPVHPQPVRAEPTQAPVSTPRPAAVEQTSNRKPSKD